MKEYYLEVTAGNAGNQAYPVHKFGRNATVGTSYVPISLGGLYRTPTPSNATQLRVKAGNANDTAAGTGAREVTLIGINASGEEIIETLATAGESASSNTTNSFIRLYRAYVSTSGTYATASSGSHTANIVIENSAGTEDWLTIDATTFPRGQSEVAAYTVPLGKTAYLRQLDFSADTANKIVEVIFFRRDNILDETAPYSPMRMQFDVSNINNDGNIEFPVPVGPFPECTDIGVMAKIDSGTTELHVSFILIVRDNE